MAVRDVAGDGKPEADAARVRVARRVQPVERSEYLLALILGNARAVVVYGDLDGVVAAPGTDRDVIAIEGGVAHQVGDTAFECVGPDRQRHVAFGLKLDLLTLAPRFTDNLIEQRRDVDWHRFFSALALGKGEIFIEHFVHLGDVGFEFGDFGTVPQHGVLQFHSGERRAQIMRHPGQHFRALDDLPLDALAHEQEGRSRLAYLGGAGGLEVGHVTTLAEAVRGGRQSADGTDLVAHEHGGDRKQDKRGSRHPHDEDVGGRAEQPLARREHLKHAVRKLDVDFHLPPEGSGVDRKRPAHALGERVGEHAVEGAGAWRRRRVRQDFTLPYRRPEAHFVARHLQDPRLVLGPWHRAHQVDDHGDLAGERAGAMPGDRVPVALVKDQGDHDLQQDQRRDDDQKRAA